MKLTTTEEVSKIVLDLHDQKKSIGFVPTMGFLHEGHLSLVKKARSENDQVVVSIFVNPAQFGPDEDFEFYPKNLEQDLVLLEGLADYVFCPEVGQIYPKKNNIGFKIEFLADHLCGPLRPGHFEGVLQVLAKLLNIVQPQKIYLGQKDYQQFLIVKRMVEELFFQTDVVMGQTVRDIDGLALSSRNVYLGQAERKKAPLLYQALQLGLDLIKNGERKTEVILAGMESFLKQNGILKIDYIDLLNADDLQPVTLLTGGNVLLAAAIHLGKTRLIDNLLYVFER